MAVVYLRNSVLRTVCSLEGLHRQFSRNLAMYLLVLQVFVGLLHDLRLPIVSHRTSAYDWHGQSLYLDTPSQSPQLVYPEDIQIFRGTEDGTGDDRFKEILLDGDNLLIGSKNVFYQLYMADEQLSVTREIHWEPNESEISHCTGQGKQLEQCHNYIRVITKKSDSELLLCGTNAYSPSCRIYRETELGYSLVSTERGEGKCPFDHRQNSTAVYTDGRLYSGTFFYGDAVFYRQPVKTELKDSELLNDPEFVSSFAFEDKVYFFFRETAVEYINCGKAIYSRVGRVCKNDEGGNLFMKGIWTSFFKSRLNCSIPGEFPFYFDEIQSTSELGRGNYRSTLTVDETHEMIYAVFTTPQNSISGSAVCAFKMADIVATFEGTFKAQKNAHSNWLPVKESDVPVPHPAKECHNDSMRIPDNNLVFTKDHPQMDKAVPAFGGRPLLVQASFSYRMTSIAVDWQYRAVDGRRYDILYIGTDDGRVIKAINKNRSKTIETVVVEDILVFPDKFPVTKLQLYRRDHGKPVEHLVVISDSEIRTLPLHRCHEQDSCSACVQLQDPYCSWDSDQRRCINLLAPHDMDTRYFYQSIETGMHSQCDTAPSTTSSTAPEMTPGPISTSTTSSTTTQPPCEPCTCNPDSGLTPPTTPNVESKLTDPLREGTTDFNNEIPPISRDGKEPHMGQSVGQESKCAAEKIAISVIVPSIVFSIVGFLVGLFVSRRCGYGDKPQNNHLSDPNRKNTENPYSSDPGTNQYVTNPPYPQKGKVTLVHNDTKQNNLMANGSIEANLDTHVVDKTHKDSHKVYV